MTFTETASPSGVERATELGPDPEPAGSERFERLMRLATVELTHRARGAADERCPLELAFGKHAPCALRGCPYYDVPGVGSRCAVRAWAPTAGHDRRLAGWFIAVRDAARH